MPLRWPDLVLILFVVVLIFAAGKLPEIGGGLRRTFDNLRGGPVAYQSEPNPSDAGDAGSAGGGVEQEVASTERTE